MKSLAVAFRSVLLLASVPPLSAQSTIDGMDKNAYGANIGWINMRGDVTNGVVVSEYVCSGYAWSANCGWINFGDGSPVDGISYQNNSASDFGVNVTNFECVSPSEYTADLRGYAYGANIGWINFEATGDPSIDLITGELRGYAYSANCGWINLGESGVSVVTTLAPGEDTDTDGIPDAYEYTHAGPGDLVTLGALNDADKDGQLDAEEYLADTDPLDNSDLLQILSIADGAGAGEHDVTFTTKLTRVYQMRGSPDAKPGSWVNEGGVIKPDGATYTATMTDPDGGGRHYWRTEAKLPLQP